MKKAICIGINDYTFSGASSLDGCINDKDDWAELFTNLHFDEISELEDDEAIRTRIKNDIAGLVSNSVSGDLLVVTYSGHGTSVYDTSGDEGDGYDEALYVYDGVLLDDELSSIIKKLPAGVKMVFIFDSCFSGTSTKSASARKIRYVETDPKTRRLKRKKAFMSNNDMVEVLISGCGDYEYSYDAYINGNYNGAFTYNAIKCFKSGYTYQQWYDQIRKSLPSIEYPQTPGLFCNDENKSLAAFCAIGEPFVPQTEDDGASKSGCFGIFMKPFQKMSYE